MSRSLWLACTALLMTTVPVVLCGGCEQQSANAATHAPSSGPEGAPAAPESDVIVFAASSLTECLSDLRRSFARDHPEYSVEFVFQATQELLAQLEHGAPADVLATASPEHMREAKCKGLVCMSAEFARGRLCVIARPGGRVRELADLVRPGIVVLAAVAEAPVGRYTEECWRLMELNGSFGPSYVASLRGNVKSREPNVKAVVTKVRIGEADAGFVYESDARAEGDSLVAIAVPDEVNVSASYQIGVCREARNPLGAHAFIEELRGVSGADVLRRCGLTPITDGSCVESGP